MSAELLYSLSGDKTNQQKQIGCMNGFLQFFDPHQFISSRSASNENRRILPSDENGHQGGGPYGASKKTKGKHLKVIRTQENSSESSRISVSSSSASTTMSSADCEWSVQNKQSPFCENIFTDKYLLDCRVNQPYSSHCQTNISHKSHKKDNVHDLTSTRASPCKTAPREQAVRHAKNNVDSPRLLQPAKLDSPRLIARNESFRSTSSNQSATISPLRKNNPEEVVKDSPRFSHDGKVTRDSCSSILKLRDLPRLSLDSRQRTIKESVRESKDDLVLRHLRRETPDPRNAQNLPKEPASYRPPSNIVAKLMGLEDLPDCSPSIKIEVKQDDSSICGSSDFWSRSSKTIDGSRVKGVLHSPRNNFREFKPPPERKDKLVVKPKPSATVPKEPASWKKQEAQRASDKVAYKNQELNPESHKHTLTMYAKIEKRMNELDFTRSGKDLRALKQILESIHREKTKVLCSNENWSSGGEYETCSNSSTYISHKEGLGEVASGHQDCIGHIPLTEKEPRSAKKTKSMDTKPRKLVRESKKESTFAMQDLPLKNLHQIRIGKPGNDIKDEAQKKTTNHTTPVANIFHYSSHQTHRTTHNKFGERTLRPKATSNSQPMTKVNVPSPVKNSNTVSSNIYSHIPATTLSSNTKQQKPDTTGKGLRSQTEKLRQNILKDIDGLSQVISTHSTFLSQEKNTNTFYHENMSELVSQMHTVLTSTDQTSMKYDTWQLATNNKNADVSGDTSLKELTIAVREQPSPVSVLDANFYGDESPSPVKKKSTAFREYETNATDTVEEWREIDLFYSPNSLRPSCNYEKEDRKVDNFSQTVQAVRQLDYSLRRSTDYVDPQEEVNLQKAYVSEIFAASGIRDGISFNTAKLQVGQSQEAVNPKLFLILEQTKRSSYISGKKSTSQHDTIMGTNGRHRRKLLFDTVNEILSQKLPSTGLGSQPQFMKKILVPTTDTQAVLHEIFTEINQLQANSLHQSMDDEDDFLTTIIENDLAHATGNWTNISSEIPGLVLDIERLIFKDLIVELVN